jgi:beta-galactosidase
VAGIDHTYGQGKTRLIGTMVGVGYRAHVDGATHLNRTPPIDNSAGTFFARILDWAGVERHVTCSDPRIVARIHNGPGGAYLWVANPTRRERFVRLALGSAWGPYARARALWGADAWVDGCTVSLNVKGRDIAVIGLD